MEPRSSTILHHLCLPEDNTCKRLHEQFICCPFPPVHCLHVFRCLPHRGFFPGFRSRVCLTAMKGFIRVWQNEPHFFLLIRLSRQSCPTPPHTSSLVTLSSYLMWSTYRLHLLAKGLLRQIWVSLVFSLMPNHETFALLFCRGKYAASINQTTSVPMVPLTLLPSSLYATSFYCSLKNIPSK